MFLHYRRLAEQIGQDRHVRVAYSMPTRSARAAVGLEQEAIVITAQFNTLRPEFGPRQRGYPIT